MKGTIVSRFGVNPDGFYGRGITISARRGAPVRAAKSGAVEFVSEALQGYGKVIVIKHSDGFWTVYAHNAELLVEKGQGVRQGQTIARVGSTGRASRPQLHFKIFRGDKVVDPARYLP